MSKSYRARGGGETTTGAIRPESASVEADEQTLLGNDALQQQAGHEGEQMVGDWKDDLMSIWQMFWGDNSQDEDGPTVTDVDVIEDSPSSDEDVIEDVEEVVDGPTQDVDEVKDEVQEVIEEHEEVIEEEEAPKDVAKRPTSVRVGQYGALIQAGGGTVDIKDGPGAEAAVADKIPDGTPCRVVSTDGASIEVAFRKGSQEETGWVSAAVFSDQPRLFKDDNDASLMEDYTWTLAGDDQTTDELSGTDVEQGGLADCYFIAAMNAVGNANGDFLEQSISYDASSGLYTVRFFEEDGWDRSTGQPKYKEVFIEVDGYLPTKGASTSGAYASAAAGKQQWGAIMEKAYAVWKGGYNVMGDGGYGSQAMEELAGAKSSYSNTSQMKEEDVVPYFTQAQADGLAVYAGSNASMELTEQTPLSGSAEGPYTGTLKQNHNWNHIWPGTLSIEDAQGNVSRAWENGSQGDKEGELRGADVDSGKVVYDDNKIEVTYEEGKQPEKADDLVVKSEYTGMLYPAKQVIGWHGYAFKEVTAKGEIQLYNPWGSYQPKALTAAEFLEYYGSVSTVQVPQAKGQA